MNAFTQIRQRLGISQAAIAEELGCTQGNVSFYEVRDQTVPPEIARKLIGACAARGLAISFDHIYGSAELPTAETVESKEA